MTTYSSSMLSKSTRSMEEVWNDISFSSLEQDMPSTPSLSRNHHLKCVCGVATPSSTTSFSFKGIILQDFLGTDRFKATNNNHSSGQLLSPLYSNPGRGETINSISEGLLACFPKKHAVLEQVQLNQEHGKWIDDVDRRKKRMIKNRESAARSRARKQAYTNELEQEVDHLLKENRTLKRQYEELKKAMADQLPAVNTKRTLQRTLTAPF